MSDARAEILGRITDALTLTPVPDEPIAREYDAMIELPDDERLALFIDRLEDYKAQVITTRPEGVAQAVARALASVDARRIGVPAGLEPGWLAEFTGEVQIDAPSIAAPSLADLDAIVTGSAVSCAISGTIFLDGSTDQGRRALTLVPDVHVCVTLDADIVVDMPAAIRRLTPEAPITMIAGPSATSDIELQRVEGVHGPRTLIVIVVSERY